VLALPYGVLSDRYGRKPILCLGILGIVLGELWVRVVCKSDIDILVFCLAKMTYQACGPMSFLSGWSGYQRFSGQLGAASRS
jgi:MFS family permease